MQNGGVLSVLLRSHSVLKFHSEKMIHLTNVLDATVTYGCVSKPEFAHLEVQTLKSLMSLHCVKSVPIH